MLLQQAILNLLNNSIAYSSNHQANIQIGSTTNHQLSIQVSNTGATITDQEQKYLFSPFFRGENSKHKTGFGLGLSWTQKIVLYCGGDIRYEANEAQQYNTFIIKLPLS
jgi:two-component system sensor histidine kinase ArlS